MSDEPSYPPNPYIPVVKGIALVVQMATPGFRVDIAHVDRAAIVHSAADRPQHEVVRELLGLDGCEARAQRAINAGGWDKRAAQLEAQLADARAGLSVLRCRATVEAVWRDDICDFDPATLRPILIDVVRGSDRARYRLDSAPPPIDRAIAADFAPVPGWRSPVEAVRSPWPRIDAGLMDGRAIAEMLVGGE